MLRNTKNLLISVFSAFVLTACVAEGDSSPTTSVTTTSVPTNSERYVESDYMPREITEGFWGGWCGRWSGPGNVPTYLNFSRAEDRRYLVTYMWNGAIWEEPYGTKVSKHRPYPDGTFILTGPTAYVTLARTDRGIQGTYQSLRGYGTYYAFYTPCERRNTAAQTPK